MTFTTADSSTTDPDEMTARSLIKTAWGRVPHLGEALALSLPATRAVLAFDEALSKGAISAALGEQLSIAVAHENRCAYCLSAHTAAARAFGVSPQDAAAARLGESSDPKSTAALRFAQLLVRTRGFVGDAALAGVRAAGWSDSEIVEILAHTMSNQLTNYLHHLSNVPIDYPSVAFAASATPINDPS